MGSVAGVDASATTYVIGCVPPPINGTAAAATSMGLNSSEISEPEPGYDPCDFDNVSQTITQGPSTYHWAVSQTRADDALAFDCTLTGSTQAACLLTASASASPNAANRNATNEYNLHSTEIFSASNLPYQQVVLTAGLSYLKPSNASGTGPAVSSKSGHTGSTSTGTASGSKSTSKSSSGAMVMEPALGLGVAGMIAIGLAAFAL